MPARTTRSVQTALGIDRQAAERAAGPRPAARRRRSGRRASCRPTRPRSSRSTEPSQSAQSYPARSVASAAVRGVTPGAAPIRQREVALVGEDDVIEHVDPHDGARLRPCAPSAPGRRGSASDRRTDGCGRARWRRPTRPRLRGTPRADARPCVSSEPIDTTRTRSMRCLVSSMTMPKCSTGAGAVLRQQQRRDLPRRAEPRPLAPLRARACGGRVRRRPAPARRARVPTPRTRRRSSAAARVRPRSPPTAVEQLVGHGRARRAARRAAAEHERQQFVVAERAGAEPLELLARAIVRGQVSHCYTRRSDAPAAATGARRHVALRPAGTLHCRRRVRRTSDEGNRSGAGRRRSRRVGGRRAFRSRRSRRGPHRARTGP